MKGGEALISTDALSLVFIFCFLLGFGFFLMAAFLGGHGHGHAHVGGHAHTGMHTPAQHVPGHAGTHTPAQQSGGHQPGTNFSPFSYLNPTSIALFLLGFGFFGYLFHNTTNLAASLTLLIATGGGLVIAALLFFTLSRLFAQSEGSTELDVADRTGMIGRVSITIPAKGIGEIIYTSPGGLRKSIPARSVEGHNLQRDQEVVVVNYQSGVAEVDTWEHFMHEDEPSSSLPFFNDLNPISATMHDGSSSEIEMVMHQEHPKE